MSKDTSGTKAAVDLYNKLLITGKIMGEQSRFGDKLAHQVISDYYEYERHPTEENLKIAVISYEEWEEREEEIKKEAKDSK